MESFELEKCLEFDPKEFARGIRKNLAGSLRGLEMANRGKNAERTGLSARTLNRGYPPNR